MKQIKNYQTFKVLVYQYKQFFYEGGDFWSKDNSWRAMSDIYHDKSYEDELLLNFLNNGCLRSAYNSEEFKTMFLNRLEFHRGVKEGYNSKYIFGVDPINITDER